MADQGDDTAQRIAYWRAQKRKADSELSKLEAEQEEDPEEEELTFQPQTGPGQH